MTMGHQARPSRPVEVSWSRCWCLGPEDLPWIADKEWARVPLEAAARACSPTPRGVETVCQRDYGRSGAKRF
jgi:hypothetical protein